jgi:uncharacterized iron-regulated protein
MTNRKSHILFAALVAAAFAGLPEGLQANGASPLDPCRTPDADVCAIYATGRLGGDPSLDRVGDLTALSQRIAGIGPVEVLILGEAHDNPHHHKARAALVSPPAIVMEHLRADQQAGLAAFNALQAGPAPVATVTDFTSKVDWANGGWDKYPLTPLLEAVVASRAAVYAGDPPRDLIRKIAKQGPSVLSEDDRTRLALDKPLGSALDEASAAEIEASHCGMLPKTAIPSMAFAQRYRDAHLADATMEAVSGHGRAILLTGNNHARADRGVPWYLRTRAPDGKVLSIVLVEVESGQNDPETYVPRDPGGKPAADYLIFTPAIAREDPCKAFGK